jgi:hypothetical protein
MDSNHSLDYYKLELSVKAKNGINFIAAASIVWTLITIIWTLSFKAYDKSVLTFIVGGLMLPLAWVFSKLFKTLWVIENNPLQPLGLWLNFAQLFYFPILVFVMMKDPDSFVMVYVIITGAHFFPYAWFYNMKAYAVMAGIISIGAFALALLIKDPAQLYFIPAFMVLSLVLLVFLGVHSYQKNKVVFDNLKNQ